MRRVYKVLFLTCLLLIDLCLIGQQVPLMSQYYGRPTLSYSSASAMQDQALLSFIYRGQWSGLSGSPQTAALSFSNTLGKGMGYSVNVNSYELGALRQTYVAAGFAKKVLEGTHSLSLGAEFSLFHYSLEESRISLESLNDGLVQGLLGSNGQALGLNLSMSYRYKAISVHAASPGLGLRSLSNEAFAELNQSNAPDYLAGLYYDIVIDPVSQLKLVPNITWRYQDVIGSAIDLAAHLSWKDKYGIVLGYREGHGVTAGLGLQVKRNIRFSYSYDFGKSDVPFLSDGFNEIGLHFNFSKKEKTNPDAEENALKVIDRLREEEIYDKALIAQEDQEAVVKYYGQQTAGNKRKKREEGEARFESLLTEIKEAGMARMQAEAKERKQAAERRMEEERVAQEKALLAQEAKEATQNKVLKENDPPKSVETQEVKPEVGDFIIVVSAHRPGSAYATQFLEKLRPDYPEAGIFQSKSRGYDYVYIEKFNDFEKAIDRMKLLRSVRAFPDSWVHILRLSQE